MSKFLKIFAPMATGALGVIGIAYTAADQFVTDIPSATGRIVSPVQAQATPNEPSVAPAEEVVVAVANTPGSFGLGREATEAEIAAWDLDIMPDGTGLPVGSGDVWTGEEVFADACASCHGDFAEGVDNWPKLAGGMDTLDHEDPLKTVGSYWPYLSTTFDYVRRSMPFGNAQSLSDDDVYAIVAYILYSNDLVDDDFTLSDETFFDVEMPNAAGFIIDDRATTEAHFIGEPCMTDCKEAVEITMRARVLDVTPDDATAEAESTPSESVEEEAVVEVAVAADETAAEPAVADSGGIDPALVAAGEKAFKKCAACHQVGEGAKNRSGPHLNGVFGRTAGTIEGFKYSKDMVVAGEEGLVWTDETMATFLTKPKDMIKRTKMSFAGFKKEDDIAAVSAYLKSVGN